MTRKEFLAASAAMMAAGAARAEGALSPNGKSAVSPKDAPPRNRHPYKGIAWATAHQIRSTTHVHCKAQADLDVILKRNDFSFFTDFPFLKLEALTVGATESTLMVYSPMV